MKFSEKSNFLKLGRTNINIAHISNTGSNNGSKLAFIQANKVNIYSWT